MIPNVFLSKILKSQSPFVVKGIRLFKVFSVVSMSCFFPFATNASGTSSVGGYGELHLNYTEPDTGVAKPAFLDFHRFVIFFGHRFSENWSFVSEVELEHNYVEGNKPSGYLILEQAFIKWQAFTEAKVRVGILLQPQGLLNEKHEPTQFESVERPEYHKVILPTTWFGAGLSVSGEILNDAVQYNIMATEGLNDTLFGKNKQGIREARQRNFYSKLDNVLGTIRIDYVKLDGLIVGGSLAVNETVYDPENKHLYNRAIISEIHGAFQKYGLKTTVEFCNISYSPIENRVAPLKRTQGLLTEISYNLGELWESQSWEVKPFFRFSKLNPSGSISDTTAVTRIDAGFAVKPIDQIVFKADFGRDFYENEKLNKTYFNAGIGYDF